MQPETKFSASNDKQRDLNDVIALKLIPWSFVAAFAFAAALITCFHQLAGEQKKLS